MLDESLWQVWMFEATWDECRRKIWGQRRRLVWRADVAEHIGQTDLLCWLHGRKNVEKLRVNHHVKSLRDLKGVRCWKYDVWVLFFRRLRCADWACLICLDMGTVAIGLWNFSRPMTGKKLHNCWQQSLAVYRAPQCAKFHSWWCLWEMDLQPELFYAVLDRVGCRCEG